MNFRVQNGKKLYLQLHSLFWRKKFKFTRLILKLSTLLSQCFENETFLVGFKHCKSAMIIKQHLVTYVTIYNSRHNSHKRQKRTHQKSSLKRGTSKSNMRFPICDMSIDKPQKNPPPLLLAKEPPHGSIPWNVLFLSQFVYLTHEICISKWTGKVSLFSDQI